MTKGERLYPSVEITNGNETAPISGGQLIIITGPTASGKDTVMERVLKGNKELERIVTTASRPPRSNEAAGHDYNYIQGATQAERDAKFLEGVENKEFVEHHLYGSGYYGTPKNCLPEVLKGKRLVWRIDPSAAGTVEKIITDYFTPEVAKELLKKTVVIYIGADSLNTLKRRYLGRSTDPEPIAREKFRERIEEDWEVWNKCKDNFQNVVINHDGLIEETVEKVISIINKQAQNL